LATGGGGGAVIHDFRLGLQAGTNQISSSVFSFFLKRKEESDVPDDQKTNPAAVVWSDDLLLTLLSINNIFSSFIELKTSSINIEIFSKDGLNCCN
jgi:hypothetical protein